MSRYDWPRPPRNPDRQQQRAAHLERRRPPADPALQPAVSVLPAPAPTARKRSARALPKDAPALGQSYPWIPVGPSVMVNGQAEGNPNVAGRIRDIRVSPDGQRVYAASASGGVWFSPDRGRSWTPLDNWVQSPDRADVASLANALASTSLWVQFGAGADTDTVWVGTGELTSGILGVPGYIALDQGTPGGHVRGVGILHAVGPAAATNPGHWQVEKGGPAPGDPGATPATSDGDTLRGATVFRIAGHPDDPDHLYAATDRGLYFGTTAGATTTWIVCNPKLFGTAPGMPPIDVAVTKRSGKFRLWVAAYSTLVVADFAAGLTATPTFTPVPLADVLVPLPGDAANVARRTRLETASSANGDRLYVLGRRSAASRDAPPPAQLWQVDAQAANPATSAQTKKIDGLPAELFKSTDDQSDYDMAIAAHPSQNDRVIVCGASYQAGGEYNGAIYRCDISDSAADCTYIGAGVHPDDHVVRFAANGSDTAVFIGCDGGVFRSDREGDSFVAVNDGLAVLEPGYVASHPTNPGLLAAGFQDNGTALRVGESVWRQTFRGDGGGVVFHPTDAARYLRQYVQGTWETSSGSFTRPVMRRNAHTRTGDPYRNSEAIESSASSFYSGADSIQLGAETHLALGSDRVWYSRDFGASWVTLPTGTDPRAGDNPDLAQDVLDRVVRKDAHGHVIDAFYADRTSSVDCCSGPPAPHAAAAGSPVIAVKFAKPTADGTRLQLLALTTQNLSWMQGQRTGTSGPFTWQRDIGLPPGTDPKTVPAAGAFRAPRDATETNALHAKGPLAFLPCPGLVSDVAVHDPTAGRLGSCYVATIGGWRFADATTNDAYLDTLWFFDGTDRWWPTGLRVARADCPWTGTRVTAPALGVLVDPEHPETVYVATSVGVVRGTLGHTGTAPNLTYTWAWQAMMNGLPEAAVQDLSLHWYPRPAGAGAPYEGTEPVVKVLRAGLQARGVWEVDLATEKPPPLTYVRVFPSDARRRPRTLLTGPTARGEDDDLQWDASPDVVVDTSDTVYDGAPSEAVLWKIPQSRSWGSPASILVREPNSRVHVLVHHRSPDPAVDVRVALLRHDLPDDGNVPLAGLWANLVTAVTGSNAPSPPTTLPAGWTAAGASVWRSVASPIDPRAPQAVTFHVDWSGESVSTPFVLLAVVASATNLITVAEAQGATTVQDLVLNSPHCAARSVQVWNI